MKRLKILALVMLLFSSSCKKYLEAVPDKSLAIPRTVKDFEQMLQNELLFNVSPAIGEFGSDDLYLPDALLATQIAEVRNGYVWAKDIYEGASSNNWNDTFTKIYYCNVVLEGLANLSDPNATQSSLDLVKGWALFCRANAFYDLAQVYAAPYRPAASTEELGIPIKLNTNLSEIPTRASLRDTYKQIRNDLELAISLLPTELSKTNRSKPAKATAYAFLARLLLVMQDYPGALKAAESSLLTFNVLTDYNRFNTSSSFPFTPVIEEVIYQSVQLSFSARSWQVDQSLFNSFETNDLRKQLFFNQNLQAGTVTFKGFYSNNYIGFNGFATDEVYLIKAECEAREHNDAAALETLNALLIKRYKIGTYVPYTTSNTTDALSLILKERRKECIFRNLRWSDLRRLNQDPIFSKTLTRNVKGITYTLLPNDPRYVLPIPDVEIRSSGMQQNPR